MREEIETNILQTILYCVFTIIDEYIREDYFESLIFYSRIVLSLTLFILYMSFYNSGFIKTSRALSLSYYSILICVDGFIFFKILISLHGGDYCEKLSDLSPSLIICYTNYGYIKRIYISTVCFVLLIFCVENVSYLTTRLSLKSRMTSMEFIPLNEKAKITNKIMKL